MKIDSITTPFIAATRTWIDSTNGYIPKEEQFSGLREQRKRCYTNATDLFFEQNPEKILEFANRYTEINEELALAAVNRVKELFSNEFGSF